MYFESVEMPKPQEGEGGVQTYTERPKFLHPYHLRGREGHLSLGQCPKLFYGFPKLIKRSTWSNRQLDYVISEGVAKLFYE